MATAEKGRVCVTGAGGFIASWLVKVLLLEGFAVHGTVRDPSDEKNTHILTLDKATEQVKLCKAELLDYQSILAAVEGCFGVFHVASPLSSPAMINPEVELLEPAVKGTLNVLKACTEANVKRVVFVSSAAAVVYNPDWPKDQLKDENCWSDKDFCKTIKNWYAVSKLEAELKTVNYGKKSGLDIVTVCPSFVFGPILHSSAIRGSSSLLLNILKEGYESIENVERMVVDVRDLAKALLIVFEKPEAKGRYICSSHPATVKDIVDRLQSIYPNYKYPNSYVEVEHPARLTSDKLQGLGWRFRPLEETLIDSVQSYKQAGFLD